MASGLIALLDDVAMLAKLAASSIDDVAGAAGKAATKAAGVVVDDAAVTPRYVTGLGPERELPIIAKITLGSLRNKLLLILPAALLLSAFAPFSITPILMCGGLYLAFEGTEEIVEALSGDHHDEQTLIEADTPEELEARQIAGAIRTDFILSAEIMAIALASLEDVSLSTQAAALVGVAILITLGVYGTVALIVKLDDIGLHLCRRNRRSVLGALLVDGVPYLLSSLSTIGTVAMLWVGGGILLHGLEEVGVHGLAEIKHAMEAAASSAGGVAVWLAGAVAASMTGIIAGLGAVAMATIVRRLRPAR